jgi:hypothetical protein
VTSPPRLRWIGRDTQAAKGSGVDDRVPGDGDDALGGLVEPRAAARDLLPTAPWAALEVAPEVVVAPVADPTIGAVTDDTERFAGTTRAKRRPSRIRASTVQLVASSISCSQS